MTIDAFPPATITDLAALSPTATFITLWWIAPGDNGTLGTAAGYVVKYSTSGPITASNWATATTYTQSWTPLSANDIQIETVTGLNPNTTYWFAVEAYDKAGNYGGVSNSPSGTTTAGSSLLGLNTGTLLMIGGGASVVIAVVLVAVVLSKRKNPTTNT